MRNSRLDKKLYHYYQDRAKAIPMLEKTFLSRNILARMYLQRRANEIFEEILPLIEEKNTVLDIGCGAGWFLNRFAIQCSQTIGVDLAMGYLLQAKQFLKDKDTVSLIQCDAHYIPLASDSVDVILMTEVIEHIISPEQALAEIKRVLRREGWILITAPSVLNAELAERLISKLSGEFHEHLHSWTPGSLKKLMEREGFTIFKAGTCCFLPIPWVRVHFNVEMLWVERTYNFIEDTLSRVPGINSLGRTIVILAKRRE